MTACLLKSFGNIFSKYVKNSSKSSRIWIRVKYVHTTNRKLRTKCSDGPLFTTRLALPPDYDNVVDFMCEEYYKNEPVIINIGLGDTEAPDVWRKMMRFQVGCGMSFVAEDRDNCIIGAALNIKTCAWEGDRMREIAKCCSDGPMRQVLEFFGYVAEKPDLWKRYGVYTIIEQSSLAVCNDFRGLGIGRRLVQESWILARDCGYRLFRQDCNSQYCARICANLGWEKAWSLPFSQYAPNGEVVFKHIQEPHTECHVYVDRLQNHNTYCPPYKHS